MIIDGRMPTPEQAEAQLRERLAADHAASPTGADADDLRVDTIAARLEEIEQQRLDGDWIEQERLEQDMFDAAPRRRFLRAAQEE
jgi:hypothetical protein